MDCSSHHLLPKWKISFIDGLSLYRWFCDQLTLVGASQATVDASDEGKQDLLCWGTLALNWSPLGKLNGVSDIGFSPKFPWHNKSQLKDSDFFVYFIFSNFKK